MLRSSSSGIQYSGGGIGLPTAGIVKQSAVAASVTGTLTETVLATIVVPANTLGLNGKLVVKAMHGFVGTNGTKNPRIRINGTAVHDPGAFAATNLSYVSDWHMYNANSLTAQARINTQIPNAANTISIATTAFDTTQPMTITISEQLGNVADTATLYAYSVELLNP